MPRPAESLKSRYRFCFVQHQLQYIHSKMAAGCCRAACELRICATIILVYNDVRLAQINVFWGVKYFGSMPVQLKEFWSPIVFSRCPSVILPRSSGRGIFEVVEHCSLPRKYPIPTMLSQSHIYGDLSYPIPSTIHKSHPIPTDKITAQIWPFPRFVDAAIFTTSCKNIS